MKEPVLITSAIHFALMVTYSLFMSEYLTSYNRSAGVVLMSFVLTWLIAIILSVWVSEATNKGK